jgi:hypothetical protein
MIIGLFLPLIAEPFLEVTLGDKHLLIVMWSLLQILWLTTFSSISYEMPGVPPERRNTIKLKEESPNKKFFLFDMPLKYRILPCLSLIGPALPITGIILLVSYIRLSKFKAQTSISM